jgi:hypothetical protein
VDIYNKQNVMNKPYIKQLLREELLKEENKTLLVTEITKIIGEENKDLITESVVLDIIGILKNFLTGHRTAELLTALTKIILKVMKIDTNMDGVKDKCEDNCSVMLIQKLSNFLHGVHHKIIDILKYVAAVMKFKSFKPSNEQKESVKPLVDKIFNAFLFGCLIYYTKSLGINLYDLTQGGQNYLALIIPSIGVVSKISELNQKFNESVSLINAGIGAH